MNKLIKSALLATTLAVGAHAAVADDLVRENRTVDANVVKVRLGGVIRLNLRQGPTPSLVVSGDRRYVGKVTTTQRGDTLVIDMENNSRIDGNGKNELRADLTVPNLQEFVSQGVGSSEVSGFSGDKLKLALDGAGAVRFTGQYRDVDARLGGVGGLTLNPGQAERIAASRFTPTCVEVRGRLCRSHLFQRLPLFDERFNARAHGRDPGPTR